MFSKRFLPKTIAWIVELKLSSNKKTDDAFFAVFVPLMFIAKPTSAFFRARASIFQSPTTATTEPDYYNPFTIANLSSGVHFEITVKLVVS
jgi:hypothetical protein